jgi:dihydrolipoamide dehydrogenase
MRRTKIAIIGAGSAGLSALRQVKTCTDDYLMFDPGPLGTTCARVGCMPSKVLIQTAKDYHRCHELAGKGIRGTEGLGPCSEDVLKHVRALRDKFAGAMRKVTEELAGDHLVRSNVRILAPDRIAADGEEIGVERLIIAVGSHPVVPGPWRALGDGLLTSDTVFEQEQLPRRIAVIGLGIIGLELGQAFARLGHEVTGFDMKTSIGGLTDPEIIRNAINIIGSEFRLYLGQPAQVKKTEDGIEVKTDDVQITVDAIIAAMGVVPNIVDMGMENLGVELDQRGIPPFDRLTMQVADLPVFIAGDANGCRPVLHEALDEGLIAGQNVCKDEMSEYCRRDMLRIVFSDPELAVAGRSYAQTIDQDPVIGSADFSDQSRAMVEGRAEGLLRIYMCRKSANLLGAEMSTPDAEHLAHLLAWAVQQNLGAYQLLRMPYYHPTLEEGIRSAVRHAVQQLPENERPDEVSVCASTPEQPLC